MAGTAGRKDNALYHTHEAMRKKRSLAVLKVMRITAAFTYWGLVGSQSICCIGGKYGLYCLMPF